MRYPLFFVILCMLFCSISAQNITNEEIWKQGKYFPKSIGGINSMNDGEHYTILSNQGIEQYSYKTFKKVKTIKSGQYSGYEFNANEKWLLLEKESDQIFRYSKRAKYVLYDLINQKEFLVFNGKKVQEPSISPDGTKLAFMAEDNNLYYQEIQSGNIVQITFDGKINHIKNGITDWVYEEEFGFVRAFDWNGNSDKIAFLRFDESQVKEMNIDVFGKTLYPNNLIYKYPKAGEKNAEVSVHVYDLPSNKTNQLILEEERADFYIPRIEYNHVGKNNANDLYVFVSNRHQNKVEVLRVNTSMTPPLESLVFLTETDKAYIETDHFDFIPFADVNNQNTQGFIWTSEKDGFRHIYWLDANGQTKQQLTKGNWEVTKVYGFNPKTKNVYFQSNQTGSVNKTVHYLNINQPKKQVQLTPDLGVSNASFSNSYQYFINSHSTANQPPMYTLQEGKTGQQLKVLEDNAELQAIQKEEEVTPVEFMQIQVNNQNLNAWTIKPKDFNPNKKYPLFMFQYSGPGSQKAIQQWDYYNYWWFQSLAQQGYIVACVDGRGTGGKGAMFKKATYQELGKLEIQDQISAAKYFGNLDYIDANRIGIFGWSYGGYMASLAMTKGANTFKLGIAVAPVTNWRFYDTIYTERFMRTPQENPNGYDDNSPINHVEKLKGKYLLIHGSGDDNVHVQNTMQMVEALVQENKDFELFLYPDKNHGIYGGNTRLHLYNKMTNFIKENL